MCTKWFSTQYLNESNIAKEMHNIYSVRFTSMFLGSGWDKYSSEFKNSHTIAIESVPISYSRPIQLAARRPNTAHLTFFLARKMLPVDLKK